METATACIHSEVDGKHDRLSTDPQRGQPLRDLLRRFESAGGQNLCFARNFKSSLLKLRHQELEPLRQGLVRVVRPGLASQGDVVDQSPESRGGPRRTFFRNPDRDIGVRSAEQRVEEQLGHQDTVPRARDNAFKRLNKLANKASGTEDPKSHVHLRFQQDNASKESEFNNYLHQLAQVDAVEELLDVDVRRRGRHMEGSSGLVQKGPHNHCTKR